MNKTPKELLVALGADVLAEALLELADKEKRAGDLVTRLITGPEEKIKRFKSKLSGLKRSKRFVPRRESSKVAGELEELLALLKSAVTEPQTGAELVLSFCETDTSTLGRCDDSDGIIGDVYRYTAPDLFRGWAAEGKDKKGLVKKLSKVVSKDDCGVRDALLKEATQWLSEDEIRHLIALLAAFTEKQDGRYDFNQGSHCQEILALQVQDAPLFERVRRGGRGELCTADYLDIAQAYFDSGEVETARGWLERVSDDESFQAMERAQLLVCIYGALGENEKQAKLAWWMFRRTRSMADFERVIGVIGEEKRGAALAGEFGAMMSQDQLSYEDLSFLVKLGNLDDVERYLMHRADQIDGDYYWTLAPLAKQMDEAGYPLSATFLYRALLDSILKRAQTKTYPMGVRYLKRLDKLALDISDWRTVEEHGVYAEGLRTQHGRKTSFWSRYDG